MYKIQKIGRFEVEYVPTLFQRIKDWFNEDDNE